MTITFIGMPASGKSCMGRALSRKLGMKLVDADRIIERENGMKLQEIIDSKGMEAFKKIEENTLLSLSGDNLIISPGGSAVYYESAMKLLKSLGPVVYLYCSSDVIIKRLGDYSRRGVVLKPGQTILDLYNERHELYKKYFPNGGASIFTFDIRGGVKEAHTFIDHLTLFSLLANVADVKSLVIHPATTTHSQLTEAELLDQGIRPSTIRLSIGTEHIDDIIGDLEQGFAAVRAL